jgi:hypothetical protein
MADDKTKNDRRDRSKVAAEDGYEVEYLAETTGITRRSQALALLQKHGNDRATLVRAAKKLKA